MDLINNNESGYRGFLNDNQYNSFVPQQILLGGAYYKIRQKQNKKKEQQAGQRISEYAQSLEGEREDYRKRFLNKPEQTPATTQTTDALASQQTETQEQPAPKKSKALIYGVIGLVVVGTIIFVASKR